MVTDEQWQSIFQEQSASGLTQKRYCESKGISLKSFCSRKSRMKAAGIVKTKPKKYNFIRAQKEEPITGRQQAAILNLRIKIKNGLEIEFPVSALRSVITILNGGIQ